MLLATLLIRGQACCETPERWQRDYRASPSYSTEYIPRNTSIYNQNIGELTEPALHFICYCGNRDAVTTGKVVVTALRSFAHHCGGSRDFAP
jgi:hypothetical protein